ncbi:MAG TPA: hypothetical protein VK066_15630 [Chloroflexota bacterium]|nr:hypothetical protein [Chloroflexota bacterium]
MAYRLVLLAALLTGLLPGSVRAQGDESACRLRAALEYPLEGASINAGVPIGVEGWAVDEAAPAGTGILGVQAALDVPREAGGTAYDAWHTEQRADVVAQLGDPQYLFSGYRVDLPTADLDEGPHTLYVAILTRCGWHTESRQITVLPPGVTVA